MPIINVRTEITGESGLTPKFIYLDTTDTTIQITAGGYLETLKNQGINPDDSWMALVSYFTPGPIVVKRVGLFDVDLVDGKWSLIEYGGSGGSGTVGPGTANTLSMFTSSTVVGDSGITQAAGNFAFDRPLQMFNSVSDPATTAAGSLYWDSDDTVLKVYDGVSWVSLAGGGGSVGPGTVGKLAVFDTATSVADSGMTEAASEFTFNKPLQMFNSVSDPASVAPGGIYWDSDDTVLKVYNGVSWVSLTAGGGAVGPGTVNRVAKFTPDSTSVGNSSLIDDGTSAVKVDIDDGLSLKGIAGAVRDGLVAPVLGQLIYKSDADDGIQTRVTGGWKYLVRGDGTYAFDTTQRPLPYFNAAGEISNSEISRVNATGNTVFYGVDFTSASAKVHISDSINDVSTGTGATFAVERSNNTTAVCESRLVGGIFGGARLGFWKRLGTHANFQIEVTNADTNDFLNKFRITSNDSGITKDLFVSGRVEEVGTLVGHKSGIYFPGATTAERTDATTGVGIQWFVQPGQFCYDSTLNEMFYWDGSQWVSAKGGGTVAGSGTTPKVPYWSTSTVLSDSIMEYNATDSRMIILGSGTAPAGTSGDTLTVVDTTASTAKISIVGSDTGFSRLSLGTASALDLFTMQVETGFLAGGRLEGYGHIISFPQAAGQPLTLISNNAVKLPVLLDTVYNAIPNTNGLVVFDSSTAFPLYNNGAGWRRFGNLYNDAPVASSYYMSNPSDVYNLIPGMVSQIGTSQLNVKTGASTIPAGNAAYTANFLNNVLTTDNCHVGVVCGNDPASTSRIYFGRASNGQIAWVGMNPDTLRMKNELSGQEFVLQSSSTTAPELISAAGFKISTVTTAQRLALPNVEGVLITDSDTGKLYYNDGVAWSSPLNPTDGVTGSGTVGTYAKFDASTDLADAALSETATEIQAALPVAIPSLVADPASTVEGALYWKSDTDVLRAYNGTAWQDVGGGGGGGISGSGTALKMPRFQSATVLEDSIITAKNTRMDIDVSGSTPAGYDALNPCLTVANNAASGNSALMIMTGGDTGQFTGLAMAGVSDPFPSAYCMLDKTNGNTYFGTTSDQLIFSLTAGAGEPARLEGSGGLKIQPLVTAQRIALSPENGKIVPDSDLSTMFFNDGTGWLDMVKDITPNSALVGSDGLTLTAITTATRTGLPNVLGQIFPDSDDNKLYFNDGTSWVDLTGGGGTFSGTTGASFVPYAVSTDTFANSLMQYDDGNANMFIKKSGSTNPAYSTDVLTLYHNSSAASVASMTLEGGFSGGSQLFLGTTGNPQGGLLFLKPDTSLEISAAGTFPQLVRFDTVNNQLTVQGAGIQLTGISTTTRVGLSNALGRVVADSTDNKLYFNNGSTWVDLTAGGGGGSIGGTVSSPAVPYASAADTLADSSMVYNSANSSFSLVQSGSATGGYAANALSIFDNGASFGYPIIALEGGSAGGCAIFMGNQTNQQDANIAYENDRKLYINATGGTFQQSIVLDTTNNYVNISNIGGFKLTPILTADRLALPAFNGIIAMDDTTDSLWLRSTTGWVDFTRNTTPDSIVVGSPTGGNLGLGTINAQGVYDDGVLLTDFVFEKYYLGAPLEERHADYEMKSLQEEVAHTKEKLHLSTMPSRAEFESRKMSLGDMATRLWETVETQFLYIKELEERICKLEGK